MGENKIEELHAIFRSGSGQCFRLSLGLHIEKLTKNFVDTCASPAR